MPNGATRNPTAAQRDERIVLPLDPEVALRALMKVKPDDSPDWVVERSQPGPRGNPMFLDKRGKWGTIATARWFDTIEEANAAARNAPDQAIASNVHAAPRS